MQGSILILSVIAASCVKPLEATQCGDFTCGLGAICSPDGARCVAPETVDACRDLDDGERCTYTGIQDGVCDSSVCIPGGCGNGILETALGEVCDDGNFISLDGCRGDCKSTEVCGDGIQDLGKNEYCDCGTSGTPLLPCNGPNSEAPGATCRLDCTLGRCGDGVVDPHEQCDDGNNLPGDGCRADCAGRWTRMQSNTLAPLQAVWAASPTDAWAVGQNRIMRWNGTVWYQETTYNAVPRNYEQVCGLNAQDVFVLSEKRVYRYHPIGGSNPWTDVTPSSGYTWAALHCRGPNVWVAGHLEVNNYGAFGLWNDTTFDIAGGIDLQGAQLVDIWESLDGVLFAADITGDIRRASSNRVNWPSIGGTKGRRIAGTTAVDLSTIMRTTGTSAQHYNGASWSPILRSDDLYSFGIGTVPNTTPSTSLLVGAAGGILECTATSCTVSATDTPYDLVAVWALSPTQAFVVGDHGVILY